MAFSEGVTVSENQRWTAKRKAEVVLDIIEGMVTLVEFCRAKDLKQEPTQRGRYKVNDALVSEIKAIIDEKPYYENDHIGHLEW